MSIVGKRRARMKAILSIRRSYRRAKPIEYSIARDPFRKKTNFSDRRGAVGGRHCRVLSADASRPG